ncbi:MAG: hypothetical protein KDE19_09390 [Caldilineaceae bacterium]|nr:hypothetical protein [Caldilineaceae bacterium]
MRGQPVIDLAPGHKLGLIASSPVLLAGGILGLGDTLPVGVDTSRLGGVVVGPLQRHPRAGAAPPRLADAPGHFVLESGLQNRGVNATRKRYARYWSRLGCPVIVQLADTDLHFLAQVAGQLAEHEGVSGFELLVPRLQGQFEKRGDARGELSVAWLQQALRVVDEQSDLPIWVKLPLEQAAALAPIAVAAGAAAIVVGRPPLGMLARTMADAADTGDGQPDPTAPPPTAAGASALIRGEFFGPALLPLMLSALSEVVQQALPAAIIACGGIHTAAAAEQALAVGATAFQLDSAVWIEPGIVDLIQRSVS